MTMSKVHCVCHITCAHRAKDSRIYFKECRSLAKAGYDVTLIAPGDSFDEDGVHVIGIGDKPTCRRDLFTSYAKKAVSTAYKTGAELFHLHDPQLVPFSGRLRKKGKVVFDSHENYYGLLGQREWIPRFVKLALLPFWPIFVNHYFKKMDGVVVADESVGLKVSETGTPHAVIHNYPLLADARGEHVERGDGRLKIVFAGGVVPQWSHELVLDAIENIDCVEYELCGSIRSEGYRRRLEAHPAWKKVHYWGLVPFVDVKAIIQSADVAVAILQPQPNTNMMHGTMGVTKLFECMAQSLPIICTGFDTWKKVVENNDCGICVSPDSVNELKNALRYLIDNPDRAREMGENGQKAVLGEYNWECDAKKLLELYKIILCI